ncbi:MAG: 3-hydroxyacyl-CoA dehydrogenase, partial [Planctomycetota bacterium]|nr:3-hydroxyacyl-CoA dehydrogenase [Planctomycetota bacterium]
MVKKVCVIGAGTMGSGIAQKIAQEGFEVLLLDLKEEFLRNGMERIKSLLKEGVEKKIFKEADVERILGRIKTTTREEDAADCDLVIEAVFEDEKVKAELFKKLNKVCKKECIFATNTSSLSVTALGSASGRPERFVGMHYFYHPAKNRLLEVISGEQTDEEVLKEAAQFGYLHGKTVITVKDTPGFIVNRFFVPWLNEAVRLVSEGWTNPKTVDEAVKESFGIGMGPFELMNVTGIPIAYHSMESLRAKLGEFYAPSALLKERFEKGTKWEIEKGDVEKEKFELVRRRMLGAVFFVVGEMLDEEVASPADIDRGAKIALRWRKGPFEMMNAIGIGESYWLVYDVSRRYGVELPKAISAQYLCMKKWRIDYVDLRIDDSIAHI